MRVGIIVRDRHGIVRGGRYLSLPNIIDPATVEAMKAWQAIDQWKQLGLMKVILEGDSLKVIQDMQKEGDCWRSYKILLNDAKYLLRSCQQWEVNHVRREGNGVAQRLAKMALVLGKDQKWSTTFPKRIRNIVLSKEAFIQ
jgi:hypothetical protein